MVGKKIAILRTDIKGKEYLLRDIIMKTDFSETEIYLLIMEKLKEEI